MKKSFSILAIMLFLCVSFVLAQDKISREKPDLSGTWVLVQKAKSSIVSNYTLKIEQTGEEIQISQSYEVNGTPRDFTLTLFSDKRGEKNLIFSDVDETEIKSETYWRKTQLFRYITFYRNSSGNWIYMPNQTSLEKYELSKDGNTLTIVTQNRPLMWDAGFEPSSQDSNYSRRSSWGTSSKRVFRKADG